MTGGKSSQAGAFSYFVLTALGMVVTVKIDPR